MGKFWGRGAYTKNILCFAHLLIDNNIFPRRGEIFNNTLNHIYFPERSSFCNDHVGFMVT